MVTVYLKNPLPDGRQELRFSSGDEFFFGRRFLVIQRRTHLVLASPFGVVYNKEDVGYVDKENVHHAEIS